MFLFKKKALYLKLKNRLTVETVFSFIYESPLITPFFKNAKN